MERKGDLFMYIGLFLIVLLAFLLIFRDKITGIAGMEQDNLFAVIEPKIPDIGSQQNTSSICPFQSQIEYFYYSKPPDSEKRNNKFGIYIYAEVGEYFELAQNLVNSNGGDWGYVLIPFNIKDKSYDKWLNVFSKLSEKHLIPIIQLHTVNTDDYKENTYEAAEFLNKFVWPIKQRYISVYNEPNDAAFWFGKVDPKEYSEVLNYTIKAFKKENSDFFMLNGAFNISAGNTSTTMDAVDFMLKMEDKVDGIFNKLDGWASHSYPQPNFSGNPDAEGRFSIRAYKYELDTLKRIFGINKDMPVFITETGWAHSEGDVYNPSYLSSGKVAENIKIAYEKYWLKDDRVVAVTPFTIWYRAPYDHFSWVREDFVPYASFNAIKSLKKKAGNPEKLETARITSVGCE
ncbi:hypothetical protein A3F07_02835 [candidate division WWE3 bacterium RIFCSPHIGHO2_12_FULL_38_15]|uniref:Asl1-like glycosyl hydrolase catalytic domain-containing protein n=1 Tax=candidate division WWE3 bacterium RIFCSPHIGHO2_02_FULL_38_14 TaxID=1802620 RepID=A0A1F4VA38_UNCKA|nr:MAG: hypothetical protein A2793_04460 [candidate division WWE3 bacterium RIFCSPHIGHO2_01_FULL_38_45]OGC49347.1 MAG: hypothetical protein A3F07_02835 [candidate division WWE3 bacterium RIFCSPHIGHO2_12_FULL_38_15]OGC53950.1 MAG: hypothetical protein A3B64_02940 [candidate division WWE3 bacterium RIFCSPLOWO2_01_FULL_37_24]OGC54026.1 MAG: hypothetical protein A3D91_04675 [candidate division WWE3 bacterium RIFCSPHIGHO2_02_FULL_38_14]HLB51461.1 hypothetical protein [Patescibacteria group bacterium